MENFKSVIENEVITEPNSDGTYILRDYQEKACDSAINFFSGARKNPALMVLPTGSGKSLIIANIVKNIQGHTLVFQPSKEILEQNFNKLLSYDQFIDASIFSASFNSKQISKVTYATIGSAINRVNAFKHFDNVIIDECHFVNAKEGMYKRFLSSIGTKKILGLTATPYRMNIDGFGGTMLKFITRTRPRVFYDLIYYAQIEELSNKGYLADIEYFNANVEFNTDKLVVNSTKMDYTDDSVRKYYKEISFEEQIVNLAQRLLKAGRKNILIFTKFVEESNYVKDKLGDICETVSAQTKKNDRERILADFRSGKIKIVTNVGVLTTGFDFPELDTILLARPTRSLALYYQMIGRAMRPHKNKESAYVVDMCKTYNRFGRVEELAIGNDGDVQWYFHSGGKRLTNVYLD